MWIEKLTAGVVALDTPIGPRYVQPNLVQRAYLIWTFRNFFSLPQQVLRPWERRLIDRLWSENRFVSLSTAGAPDRPVIGRIERRAPAQAEVLPFRKPATRESTYGESMYRESTSGSQPATAERSQEAASA
ncbi:MAG: hypothetical protein WBQ43_17085 [Terriglobales bacterium]